MSYKTRSPDPKTGRPRAAFFALAPFVRRVVAVGDRRDIYEVLRRRVG